MESVTTPTYGRGLVPWINGIKLFLTIEDQILTSNLSQTK